MSVRLVFTSGGVAGREVRLEGESFRIGRGEGQDFVIPAQDAEYVSRSHAVLTREEGAWWIEDQGSTNGTLVNGEEISRVRLRQGDRIGFGRHGPEARFDDGSTVLAPAGSGPQRSATGGPISPPDPPEKSRRPAPEPVAAASGQETATPEPGSSGGEGGGISRGAVLMGGIATVAVTALGIVTWQNTLGNPDRAFDRIAEQLETSTYLVETGIQYGDDRYLPLGTGTGFAADDDGLIITNKHVVFPEQYSLQPACYFTLMSAAKLNPVRVVTVWPGGSRFKASAADRRGDRGLGYSSENGELEIAATGSVSLGREQKHTCNIQGQSFEIPWASDVGSNNDIVVLRISSRLRGIPLAEAEPEEGDPIMVLGFPAGLLTQEGTDALPITRRGEVLRVQETIQHGAPAMGGNSGGPVVNRRGEVVGIHSAGIENTHKFAIKIDFARRIIERARLSGATAGDGGG